MDVRASLTGAAKTLTVIIVSVVLTLAGFAVVQSGQEAKRDVVRDQLVSLNQQLVELGKLNAAIGRANGCEVAVSPEDRTPQLMRQCWTDQHLRPPSFLVPRRPAVTGPRPGSPVPVTPSPAPSGPGHHSHGHTPHPSPSPASPTPTCIVDLLGVCVGS
jgi:hypothetical protein